MDMGSKNGQVVFFGMGIKAIVLVIAVLVVGAGVLTWYVKCDGFNCKDSYSGVGVDGIGEVSGIQLIHGTKVI